MFSPLMIWLSAIVTLRLTNMDYSIILLLLLQTGSIWNPTHLSIQFCFIKCKEIYFIFEMKSYNKGTNKLKC